MYLSRYKDEEDACKFQIIKTRSLFLKNLKSENYKKYAENNFILKLFFLNKLPFEVHFKKSFYVKMISLLMSNQLNFITCIF